MKNRNNQLALSYANLLINIILKENLNFKKIFTDLKLFFDKIILKKNYKEIAFFVKDKLETQNLNSIEKVLVSIILKRKIKLYTKILYFFIIKCNQKNYFKYYNIISAEKLTDLEKSNIFQKFSIDLNRDVVSFAENKKIIKGYIVENCDVLHDFSALNSIKKMQEFLKSEKSNLMLG